MLNRILIVDDDPGTVATLEAYLADDAYTIKTLIHSNQAEKLFADFEPDIVLLDLHMPHPDGLEILRCLQGARTALGFLPVVVLTGDTGRTARNSALVMGADDFLTKPLDRTEVLLRVRNLLRTRELYVNLAQANEALQQKLVRRKPEI